MYVCVCGLDKWKKITKERINKEYIPSRIMNKTLKNIRDILTSVVCNGTISVVVELSPFEIIISPIVVVVSLDGETILFRPLWLLLSVVDVGLVVCEGDIL